AAGWGAAGGDGVADLAAGTGNPTRIPIRTAAISALAMAPGRTLLMAFPLFSRGEPHGIYPVYAARQSRLTSGSPGSESPVASRLRPRARTYPRSATARARAAFCSTPDGVRERQHGIHDVFLR